MTKLTEEIVLQRLKNCSLYLDEIKQINITGRDLDDINLVKKMTALEVLSLSVNKISSLRDLQHCKYLKELYLRKNNIEDINEIHYLKGLQYLIILGLAQNPCSNIPDYRMTVVRALPKLEKLDDIPITPEERVIALRKGLKVLNPEEIGLEAEQLLIDRPIIQPQSSFFTEEKTEKEAVLSLEPDLRRDESKFSTHTTSNNLETNSSAINKCLRIDSSLLERSRNEFSVPEKQAATRGTNHSNLLPGILVLITDLDYYSLEILSNNIKNRLSQYQMSNLPKH